MKVLHENPTDITVISGSSGTVGEENMSIHQNLLLDQDDAVLDGVEGDIVSHELLSDSGIDILDDGIDDDDVIDISSENIDISGGNVDSVESAGSESVLEISDVKEPKYSSSLHKMFVKNNQPSNNLVPVTGQGGMGIAALGSLDDFNRFRQEAMRFPMLELSREQALAKLWSENKDIAAAHELVTSHLRLVVRVVRGFKGYGLPLADMASEGVIGLMRAVHRFDYKRGFRLSTYAVWWIRASVQDYIVKSWSLVRIGTTVSQRKLFFGLRRAKEKIRSLSQENLISDVSVSDSPALGFTPSHAMMTPQETHSVASDLGVKPHDVVVMDRRLNQPDLSLNTSYNNADGADEGSEWIDVVHDGSSDHSEQFIEASEHDHRHKLLEDAMAKLSERERAILTARRLSEESETLDSLSKQFGVSRERIRQIEVRAVERLREMITGSAAASPATI